MGREYLSKRRLVIFVSVATDAPYPEIFNRGPNETWTRDGTDGVEIFSVSGYPPRAGQRFVSDFREALRYRDIDPLTLVSVRSESIPTRALRALYILRKNFVTENLKSRFPSTIATVLTETLGKAIRWYDRWVLGFFQYSLRREVRSSGPHLMVNRPSVLGAFLAIQLDLLAWLRREQTPTDALFVTASAYVDVSRFVEWVMTKEPTVFFGGSSPRVGCQEASNFFSGFCQFISWEGMSRLLDGSGFRFDLSNDEALTLWLVQNGFSWEDPGIVWNTDELESGLCPLCSDSRASVVRCTQHFNRPREAELMRLLHHPHS
jgi:hypothetical protein